MIPNYGGSMIQFRNYPINIVYSLHRQKAIDPLWNQYSFQRTSAAKRAVEHLFKLDFNKMKRDLEVYGEKDGLIDAAMQWQLIEDLDPKYRREIHDYENTIENTLNTFSHTSIGKMLLDMINPAKIVWIIPADWDTPRGITWCRTEAQGGGVRISFSPSSFLKVDIGPRATGNAIEDTLFHELVHAMRYSQSRFNGRGLINPDFGNTEEFIATQFANVYHSSRRRSEWYDLYRYGGYKTKKEYYEYFANDAELVMVLKYFLKTEPLARSVANLKQPDFNPFRDFGEIEAKAKKIFGVDNFMDF